MPPRAFAPSSSFPGSSRAALTLLLAASGGLAACGAPRTSTSFAPDAGKRLTLESIYGPAGSKVDFGGSAPSNLLWLDDDRYLWPKTDPKTRKSEWLSVEALSGKSEPFAEVDLVEKALAAIPEIGADRAKKLARTRPQAWADNPKVLLFSVSARPAGEKSESSGVNDLFVYSRSDGQVARATRSPDEKEEEAELSPDGRLVAFVRANDLYAADVATGAERRLTSDGGESILNGKLDWLYQEEVYGRDTWRSFWWSPDSRYLAFLQLDEEGVPFYTLVDDAESPAVVETSRYPRPGDKNPKARLGVVAAAGGEVQWVDLARYSGGEFLIVNVAWSPSGDLAFQVQDREQTWLELNLAPAASPAAPAMLVRETSKAWVNVNGNPHWLTDGSFLWFSERTGWKHLYRYDREGRLLGAVTSGSFEARDLRGVDEKAGWVYFSGTERSPIGADEYRVRLDGQELQRLTRAPGTHQAKFNPSFTRFIDRWSDASTPHQVRLHGADGEELRVIDATEVGTLAEYGFSKPEFHQVKTRDGFEMEAMLVKPLDFDPSRRYPVFQVTYAGPHAPQVHDAWGGTSGMFHQFLAQRGVLVWKCDNRSASGKGAQSEWACHKRLGESELADIEDGIAWLREQPWVDPERIGIYGWSYGGFMASYALTHSRSFAMGIAGGSVTDWRNYDSIYTERFMQTPEHNPEGYEGTSVVAAAKNLHGSLLLVHGALDDNVHPQNAMQLVHALQKAEKPFRLMLYPKSRHGVGDPALVRHLQSTMLAFIEETLLARPGS